jgi:sn-glycerol 3-phosphate transport system permease protein
MGRYLLNSAIVTTAIMVGQVLLAILAAYAFAFLEFPGRTVLFVVFLATMMVPFEVVFFSNYHTIADLGLLDTYGGLILPFLATGFGAFLLRQAFLTVPRDLRDAAALDGYGHMRFLWRVVVPLARPTVAALGVFAFLSAWGQYLWPLVITNDEKVRTVQVGLRQLRDTSLDRINVTFAGVVLASIPLVILLLVFQRQLVRGLTAGAVKG